MSYPSGSLIRINVGGKIFETYKETLLATGGPSSKFSQLIQEYYSSQSNGDSAPSFPANSPKENKTQSQPYTNSVSQNGTLGSSNGGSTFAGVQNQNGTTPYSSGYNTATSSSPASLAAPVEKLELFFDRDPECFEHILFYLRTASLAGVRDLGTVEKLKVESEFYGLGSGFQELLKGKERILNMTLRDGRSEGIGGRREQVEIRKTYVVKIQIQLQQVEDYVKWDIERNENIIRIAIGHRTQCSTHMRYQVTEGDTYNLQMTLTVATRVNETNSDRLQRHIVRSIQTQFNARSVNILSLQEITHCAYCETLIHSSNPVLLTSAAAAAAAAAATEDANNSTPQQTGTPSTTASDRQSRSSNSK